MTESIEVLASDPGGMQRDSQLAFGLSNSAARQKPDWLAQTFLQHRSQLVSQSYRFLRCREAAEDVVQAVFLKAYERRATIPRSSETEFWLRRVVVNESLQQLRTQKRRSRLLVQNSLEPQLLPPPFVERNLFETLHRALDQKHRVVLQLVGHEGHTQEEAARALGISRGTVASRLRKVNAVARQLGLADAVSGDRRACVSSLERQAS